MHGSHDIPFATLEEAAEWYAVLRSGCVDDDERRRWQTWLAEDAGHREAWSRVEAISSGLSAAGGNPAAAGAALQAASQLRKRRGLLKTLALAAMTAGVGWQAAQQDGLRAVVAGLGASHRTGVGESRRVVLADGTQVWLNTGTVLDERFDGERRLLVLHQGEILVDTHPDVQQPPRPFLVHSRHGGMRALGTRFEVRQFAGHTRLGVSQGRVAVMPFDAAAPEQVVDTGREVTFSRSEISAAVDLPASRQLWTQGMLIAHDMPLAQFLDELSRYRHGYLGCDPAIAGLRVVGGFPLRDTDRALAMLGAALPVQAHHLLPWWVTVRPRHGGATE